VQIAERNRMTHKMIMDAIRTDTDCNNGDYKKQPRGLTTALYVVTFMSSIPLLRRKEALIVIQRIISWTTASLAVSQTLTPTICYIRSMLRMTMTLVRSLLPFKLYT
jgi:hypothetical protein